MIVKKHVSAGRLIIAACDDSLFNKTLEENDTVLDLSSQFYKGENTSREDFISLVKKSYIVNAVGEETVKALIEEDIISEDEIKRVNNIPHVQLVFEGS